MARIATITSGPPTGTGGTDRHLAALKRCFEEDGHTVECYHFEQLNPPRPWTFVDRLGYRIPGHGKILAERVLAHRPAYDLIVANSFLGAYLPSNGIPVINVFHSCDAAYADTCRPSLTGREYFRRRYVWSHFERRSARRHYVVAVSPSVAEELQRYYRIHTDAVIRPCVDTDLFRPGDRAEARRRLGLPAEGMLILYAGSWEYRKGADLVSRLAAALPAGCRVVAASPAGDPAIPVDSRMLLRRDIGPDQMVWAYRASDLFVFPTRAEAFGLVTAEALACGIPVVTTDAGLGGDLRRDAILGEWVVACPPTFEALMERVTLLLGDADRRARLGAAGRNYAERHLGRTPFEASFRELAGSLLGHRPQAEGVRR